MERSGGGGETHYAVEVAGARDHLTHPFERLSSLYSALGGGDEAEMAVRGVEVPVAVEDAKDGDAQRFEGVPEHLLVG